jgi:phage protein D
MPQKAYKLLFADEAVDEEFYGDVLAITVVEQAGASTLRLRLATRLEDDGSWRYLEDGRLAPFTKVSLRLGFTGGQGLAGALGGVTGGNDGLEPVFDGYITTVEVSLGSAPGGTAISVAALDTGVLLSLEEKVVTYADMSDSDIVQQIVGAYDVPITAEGTGTVYQGDRTTIVQRGSDLQFVRSLARRNGFEFYFETAKEGEQVQAFFRPPQLDGTPQPDLAIQFGEDSNLRSFRARLSGQRPLSVKTAQVDVEANSVNTGEAADTQLARLGASDLNAVVGGPLGGLVTPRAALAQMLVLGPPTSDPAALQAFAQAVRDEAGWFIDAGGEINCDAYGAVLRPHRLVLVKGAGTPYSGKYYVTAVTHELTGDGGYVQRFEARRNARDLDGSEQFGGAGLALPFP